MIEPTISLSGEQIAFFCDQGYLAIDRITSADEVARMREIFDRMFADRVGREEGNQFDLAGTDEDDKEASVPQILWPSKYAPELKETLYWSNALSVATQLLDMGDYRKEALIVRDHAILKPAGSGGATPWHQDEAYWDEDMEYQELSVWMPLQPATVENGCMQFIPGSHNLEIMPHHLFNDDPRIVALEVDAGQVDLSKAAACPLPPGGASIHAARTLHYASENRTQIPRRAYILTIGTPPVKRSRPRDFYWNKKRDSARERRAKAAQQAERSDRRS